MNILEQLLVIVLESPGKGLMISNCGCIAFFVASSCLHTLPLLGNLKLPTASDLRAMFADRSGSCFRAFLFEKIVAVLQTKHGRPIKTHRELTFHVINDLSRWYDFTLPSLNRQHSSCATTYLLICELYIYQVCCFFFVSRKTLHKRGLPNPNRLSLNGRNCFILSSFAFCVCFTNG